MFLMNIMMCHALIIDNEPLVAIAIEYILPRVGSTSFEVVCTEDDAVSAAIFTTPGIITL